MGEARAAVTGDILRAPEADRLRLTRRSMLGLLAMAGLTACGGGDEDNDIQPSGSPADRRAVASEAYVFGYPLVLLEMIRDRALEYAAPNRFQHTSSLPTASQRTVPRIDLDNLYSVGWLDLRDEPVLFRVPDIEGRRWTMQVLDAWTNTVSSPNSVEPEAGPDAKPPFTYAVTGPGWSGTLPDGVIEIAVPTADAWLYGRVEVRGPADVPAVRQVQSELRLSALSAWNTPAAAESDSIPENQDWSESATQNRVEQLPVRDFYQKICDAMVENPPAPDDDPAMRRFATIGIRPGGEPRGVSTGELEAGADAARKKILAYVDPASQLRNGWVLDTNVGRYGTNYLLRAATAYRGIGANLAVVVIYPALFDEADDNGNPLDFVLRFDPGQAPPVATFWSLTAYDSEGFLVQNPAGIQTVGHWEAPEFAPDGALEIAVQATDPGPGMARANWLPIPDRGQFSLLLRMYNPDQRVLDGQWYPPPLTPR